MNHERTEIMEKARAKRRRREESNSARTASRKKKAPSTDTAGSLTEKVIDLAQEAAVQVGAFVKTAADKITGANEKANGCEPRCSALNRKVRNTDSNKSAELRRN